MRILYIADVVGKPGRQMLKYHLDRIKNDHRIDRVIVNTENASHGMGLSIKNAKELFSLGIDLMTGGNHTWDKKEIIPLLESEPILRPMNYSSHAPGRGVATLEIADERLVVINLMGYFTMPMVDNPFPMIEAEISRLEEMGQKSIFIDFHAEATSEKRALLEILKGRVSAICGSHTHIGTDDLLIKEGTGYVTDVGLTGCRDNVIGMDNKEPIERFMIGFSSRFDVPDRCRKILQAIVLEIEEGRCTEAYKIKAYDENEPFVSQEAYLEE